MRRSSLTSLRITHTFWAMMNTSRLRLHSMHSQDICPETSLLLLPVSAHAYCHFTNHYHVKIWLNRMNKFCATIWCSPYHTNRCHHAPILQRCCCSHSARRNGLLGLLPARLAGSTQITCMKTTVWTETVSRHSATCVHILSCLSRQKRSRITYDLISFLAVNVPSRDYLIHKKQIKTLINTLIAFWHVIITSVSSIIQL